VLRGGLLAEAIGWLTASAPGGALASGAGDRLVRPVPDPALLEQVCDVIERSEDVGVDRDAFRRWMTDPSVVVVLGSGPDREEPPHAVADRLIRSLLAHRVLGYYLRSWF
jgi:hypothetical protein